MLKAIKIQIVFLFSLIFIACEKNEPQDSAILYSSYKDIPAITAEEIEAIEKLKEEHDYFVYGMIPSTETFHDFETGEIKGFSALFTDWMSDIFEIKFKPVTFEWNDLLSEIESGNVDFSSEFTPNEVRREKYFMTDPIAQRTTRYFRLASAAQFSEIAKYRQLRFATFEGTIIYDYVVSSDIYSNFETIFVDDTKTAYELLKSGEIDAFIEDGVLEAAMDIYEDIVSTDYFPLRYIPVSLTVQNPKFKPIISVVQKALQDDGKTINYLTKLHKQGYKDYRQHKFLVSLTEIEKEYIKNNPVIPFASEHYNYPISFYNKYEKQWQGIFFDVLEKMTEITGLSFKRMNDEKTEWSDLLNLLESGSAYIIAELIPTQKRKEAGFLWTNIPTMIDNYALLSKSQTSNILLREVLDVRVGLPRGTAYTEVFYSWFPNHPKAAEYESADDSFAALDRGEVDMVMSSQRRLLAITNYHELFGYKANIVFDQASESYFGFHKDQEILASIFNKALLNIDIRNISQQWTQKTYDYKKKIAIAQRPWLIGALVSVLCVLILLFVLFIIKRHERKRLEELVKKRTAELEAANKAKSMFLANMSHEIRTPMNAIVGMTELLIRENLPHTAHEKTIAVRQSSTHLLSIINDILDFSKIESGKMEIIPIEYSLSSLVNDAVSIIKTRIADSDSQIEFTTNIGNKIPDSLLGDETRIRQIFLNVLSNAVKYTKKGAVSFNINGEIVDNKKVILTISVSDTGKGIKEEDVKKLFGDFVQVDLTHNRGIEGTGLGLAITKSLVKAMGGDIKVKSEYGKGSTFTITIPQEINSIERMASLDTATIKAVNDKNIVFLAPSAKVLIVDDIGINLRVAKGLVSPYNMQVDLSLSGIDAIDKIKKGNYDLVFMDHMMPEMDGVEATKRIREFNRELPIIAFTATAVVGMKEMFLENGFNDFLSKPIDTRKLNEILEKWIPKEKRDK